MNFTETNLEERVWVAADNSLRHFWLLDFHLPSTYLCAWQRLAINPDRLLSSSSVLGKYNICDFLWRHRKHLLVMFKYDGTVLTMYHFKTGVSLYFSLMLQTYFESAVSSE